MNPCSVHLDMRSSRFATTRMLPTAARLGGISGEISARRGSRARNRRGAAGGACRYKRNCSSRAAFSNGSVNDAVRLE